MDPKFDELYHALYTRFTTAEAYSVFPDVLGTLKELKNHGFKMGVISNSDERVGKFKRFLRKEHIHSFNTVKVIENLKLDTYFDFVIASSLVGYEKPNKAIYEQALKLAGNGVHAEEALHVGDDVDK